MKVYELIQELTNFEASTEVEFRVEMSIEADADVDLEGEANQTVSVDIDERVSFDDIRDNERTSKSVTINLNY